MPYADQPEDFWSGYFSSRANAKKFIRDAQANLHAASKLFSMKVINEKTTDADL